MFVDVRFERFLDAGRSFGRFGVEPSSEIWESVE
jgi:hypothetical protein